MAVYALVVFSDTFDRQHGRLLLHPISVGAYHFAMRYIVLNKVIHGLIEIIVSEAYVLLHVLHVNFGTWYFYNVFGCKVPIFS